MQIHIVSFVVFSKDVDGACRATVVRLCRRLMNALTGSPVWKRFHTGEGKYMPILALRQTVDVHTSLAE
jgi:hypothetical protein